MRNWRAALIALLSLSACTPHQTAPTLSVERVFAHCQIDAANTYRNDVESESNSKYIYTCMKANGYELKTENPACMNVKIIKDATVDAGCYQNIR